MRPLWAVPAVRGLFLITLAGFVSFAVSLGALPALVVRGGGPDSAAGLPTLVMLVATVGMQVLTPMLLRRFAPTALMLVGVVLLTVPALAFAVATGLPALLAVSGVRGLGFALLTVVGAYAITSAVQPALRGPAIGLYGLAAALPTVVGPSIGAAAVVADRIALLVVVLVVPVLAAPAALWARRIPRDRRDRPGSADAIADPAVVPTGSLGSVVRRLAMPCAVLFLATGATGGLLTVVPVAIAAPWLTMLLLVVFGSLSVLSRWYAGTMVRPDALAAAGRTLVWASALGLGGLAALIGQAQRPQPSPALVAALIVVAAVLGVSTGAMATVSLAESMRLVPGAPAVVSAVWNVTFDAGTGIGAAVIAALVGGSAGGLIGFGSWALLAVVIGVAATMSRPVQAARAARAAQAAQAGRRSAEPSEG